MLGYLETVEKAIQRLVQGLSEDPRRAKSGGKEGPRDLLFTERVIHWIGALQEPPSEALLLAAWGHDLYRWRLPRDSQPMTTAGYHKWRRAQSVLSADEVSKILKEEGTADETVQKVRDLILKTNFPQDPDSRVLEDADCLAFLELKFEDYIPDWVEAKTVRILKGTLEKMSPQARERALKIPLKGEAVRLIQKAWQKALVH